MLRGFASESLRGIIGIRRSGSLADLQHNAVSMACEMQCCDARQHLARKLIAHILAHARHLGHEFMHADTSCSELFSHNAAYQERRWERKQTQICDTIVAYETQWHMIAKIGRVKHAIGFLAVDGQAKLWDF